MSWRGRSAMGHLHFKNEHKDSGGLGPYVCLNNIGRYFLFENVVLKL